MDVKFHIIEFRDSPRTSVLKSTRQNRQKQKYDQ